MYGCLSRICWPTLCLTPFPLVFPPLFSFLPPSPHHSPISHTPSNLIRRLQLSDGQQFTTFYLLHLFPPSLLLWNVKALVRLSWLNHPSLLSFVPKLVFLLPNPSFPKFSESLCSLYIPFASTTHLSDPYWEKPYFLKMIAEQLMCSTFLFF